MTRIKVEAKRDFLESLAQTTPISAIAELIWNGFDASSNLVQVYLTHNELSGLEEIRVRDYGTGIPYGKVKLYFGNLGDSWKKTKARINGRSLHGRRGKGRFRAFKLGGEIEWDTSYQRDGVRYSYKISGSVRSLDNFDISTPVRNAESSLGTEVVISNIEDSLPSLTADAVANELTKVFAVYLQEYPELKLEYDGKSLDPKTVQIHHKDMRIEDLELDNNHKVSAVVTVIEWSINTKRTIYLCDVSGTSLHEMEIGPSIKAPGYQFTVYIKSDHFRVLDEERLLDVVELHGDAQKIIEAAKEKVREYFRYRTLEERSQVVEKWKKEKIYPYDDKEDLSPIENVERQVFDILAVNVESYLPSFEKADSTSRKFTFKLLAQAIQNTPETAQKIIGEVLGLKKEDQEELARLLDRTSLSSIISSARIVANRLDLLKGLHSLLFDDEHKKVFRERDQLHKILEKEAWIFREEFALAGSEESLDTVLNKHIKKLGAREDKVDSNDPVTLTDGKQGRIDLLLHKAIQPRTGEYEYLVVELKRPTKKIDSEVLAQIKKYAFAVAADERFSNIPIKWTFIAVSNAFQEDGAREASQRGRPNGLVYDDSELNLTVWAYTWSEIINNAKSRLEFFKEKLAPRCLEWVKVVG